MVAQPNSDWNSFARANAGQKWRRQSAAMGSAMTQAIVNAARIKQGMNVLDIACGTGEPAISIATLLRGTGNVTGIDVSPAPLEIALSRAAQRGLTNAKFQQADAHALPFEDNCFDRITSRLGVMFFSDLPRALSEMHRVLKPGAQATLLSWGPVEQQPYFQTMGGTVLRFLADAKMPEPVQQMFVFGQPGVLEQALRNAHFSRAQENFLSVPWNWPGSPQEVWEYFQDTAIPFGPLLRSIPPEKHKEIEQAVLRSIEEYREGGEIKFTAAVNLTVAVK